MNITATYEEAVTFLQQMLANVEKTYNNNSNTNNDANNIAHDEETEVLFKVPTLSLPQENMKISTDDEIQKEENEKKGDESVESVQDCSSQCCNNYGKLKNSLKKHIDLKMKGNILNNRCLI